MACRNRHIVFVALLLILLGLNGRGQGTHYRIQRITLAQGLSQSTVTSIAQDSLGFMWFGTHDGLNLFDGHSLTVFRSAPGNARSLSSSWISALHVDSQNTLWVGTHGGGLSRFSWSEGGFTALGAGEGEQGGLPVDVRCLTTDSQGVLWIGSPAGITSKTRAGAITHYPLPLEPPNQVTCLWALPTDQVVVGTTRGAYLLDGARKEFRPLRLANPAHSALLAGHSILRIARGCPQSIWVSLYRVGVLRVNLSTLESVLLRFKAADPHALASHTVHDILQESDSSVWFATYKGLQRYNPISGQFTLLTSSLADPFSLSGNLVISLLRDKWGTVWAGTRMAGVNKLVHPKPFGPHRFLPAGLPLAPPSPIRAFLELGPHKVLIGTFGAGLGLFNPTSGRFSPFPAPQFSPNHLGQFVTALALDSSRNVWVGYYGEGLYRLTPRGWQHVPIPPLGASGVAGLCVTALRVDPHGNVWVGTQQGVWVSHAAGAGIGPLTLPNADHHSRLSRSRISCIYHDSRGNAWVGTTCNGLFKLPPRLEDSRHWAHSPRHPRAISSNAILVVSEDSQGNIWVGTHDGLNRYDPTTHDFTRFDRAAGLPSNLILGILEDERGMLWLSTNNGLCQFGPSDPSSPTAISYSQHHGLQSNEFSPGAFLQLRSGAMLFGGAEGFNLFKPQAIVPDRTPPDVHITRIGVPSPLRGAPSDTVINALSVAADQIVLSHRQNSLHFHFTALHCHAPQASRFQFILEGFDPAWRTPPPHQRFAEYTNLPPGRYTFRVVGANADGVWNETGDHLQVRITPPFWRAWWFVGLQAAAIITLILALVAFRESRLKRAKGELQQMVDERTREMLQQHEEMQRQAETLRQANEEITTTSEALAQQNLNLQRINEDYAMQQQELEHQKNALANIAWELQEKNEEITEQRNEIEAQKDLLSQQKKEIMDSIRYAQRIQEAVLPSNDQMASVFPDFFVMNHPKSIVSGDFYWTARVGPHRVIAVADCTGHGVPGGFMSMLGVLILREVVANLPTLNPATALDGLRQNIISILQQKGDISDSGDGLDLSLCVIHGEELLYSGANSSIMVVQPDDRGAYSLSEIRSDRMPISFYTIMKPFSCTSLRVRRGSCVYLFTDGIIDQFGGQAGRKFRLTRLREFVLSHQHLSLRDQGAALDQLFTAWKGDSFQVDDVLVVGFRL